MFLFISHRGNGKHNYKENTVKSIINVLKEDVDGVEFDIRMTKDKKFVLSHHPVVNGLIIRKSKYYKLKKHLSSLQEVLDKIKCNKIILIEIKSEFDDEKILCKKLCNILKKYNLNFYICSFNKKIIEFMDFKYKKGLIIGYYINYKYLLNNYSFNIVHYFYKDKINKNKESFIWTINNKKKLKNINNNSYIITDKYYLIK